MSKRTSHQAKSRPNSSRSNLVSRLAVAAVVLSAGWAAAQDNPNPAPAEGQGNQPPPAEGSVEVQQQANLSGPQQIAEAEKIQTRGTQISRRVQTMLDEARQEKDIIRVTCLNDKLTQINANLRTFDSRLENLREASEASDSGRRNHEYTVLTVLGQKFTVLEQEANQCIGQDIYETGATKITTTIDPDAPSDENPTEVPEPPAEQVPYIPPPASPAM